MTESERCTEQNVPNSTDLFEFGAVGVAAAVSCLFAEHHRNFSDLCQTASRPVCLARHCEPASLPSNQPQSRCGGPMEASGEEVLTEDTQAALL